MTKKSKKRKKPFLFSLPLHYSMNKIIYVRIITDEKPDVFKLAKRIFRQLLKNSRWKQVISVIFQLVKVVSLLVNLWKFLSWLILWLISIL